MTSSVVSALATPEVTTQVEKLRFANDNGPFGRINAVRATENEALKHVHADNSVNRAG
jgi:hypothetical protein